MKERKRERSQTLAAPKGYVRPTHTYGLQRVGLAALINIRFLKYLPHPSFHRRPPAAPERHPPLTITKHRHPSRNVPRKLDTPFVFLNWNSYTRTFLCTHTRVYTCIYIHTYIGDVYSDRGKRPATTIAIRHHHYHRPRRRPPLLSSPSTLFFLFFFFIFLFFVFLSSFTSRPSWLSFSSREISFFFYTVCATHTLLTSRVKRVDRVPCDQV